MVYRIEGGPRRMRKNRILGDPYEEGQGAGVSLENGKPVIRAKNGGPKEAISEKETAPKGKAPEWLKNNISKLERGEEIAKRSKGTNKLLAEYGVSKDEIRGMSNSEAVLRLAKIFGLEIKPSENKPSSSPAEPEVESASHPREAILLSPDDKKVSPISKEGQPTVVSQEKVELIKPSAYDIIFYEGRIKTGIENIKKLEQKLANAKPSAVEKIKKDIEEEKAANKIIKNKLEIAKGLMTKKEVTKQELIKPAVKDIPFYKISIESADKKLEQLRAELLSAKPSADVSKIEVKIAMEQAAKKTIEAKLKIAEELMAGVSKEKEAPKGKIEEPKKQQYGDLSQEEKKLLKSIVGMANRDQSVFDTPRFRGILRKAGVPTENMNLDQLVDAAREIINKDKRDGSKLIEEGGEAKKWFFESWRKQGVNEEGIESLWNNEEYRERYLEAAKNISGLKERGNIKTEKPKSTDRAPEEIVADIQKMGNKIEEEKVKTKFEEYEEKLSEVTGGKFNYEIHKNWYLNTLGCKVKYNFWHSKAWLVEEKTGNFIGENGEIIEKNDKKTKRAEFATGWNFPTESPTLFIEFLREMVEKRLNGFN